MKAGHAETGARRARRRSAPKAAKPAAKPQANGHAPGITEAELNAEALRLGQISEGAYELERAIVAQSLGVRVSKLDDLVAGVRARLHPKTDDSGGKPLEIADREPCAYPVDAVQLGYDLVAVIKQYLSLARPDEHAWAIALWVINTYLYDVASIAPRLAFLAPAMGSGKSTAIDLCEMLVQRPLKTDNVTPAALFRAVHRAKPTLLADEFDTYGVGNDELRGVINAGHKWNGAVTRCEGDPPEPRQFPVFGPAAFAGIGKLPGTIADRCVIIPMRRAKKGETASRLGVDCAPLLAPLAGRVARWAKDNREAVRVGKPELPESLYNRAADNWRPLCAIADVLGGEWPKRARKAAVELSVADDSQSIGVKLLDDIRRVFAEDEAKPEALDSAVIVSRLNNMADRPWPELAKGKPLTQAKMARMLREFGVGSMLIGRQRLAGYALAAFQDAFERYLPPGPPS